MRNSKGFLLFLFLPLIFCGGGPESGGLNGKNRLVLTGSSTVAPLAAEIAKRFEAGHPGIRVDVQSGGSARGINDARRGLADIGMVSRKLNQEEGDLTSTLIARDGISLIVHRDNPIATLSDEQVVAVFTGAVTNWREVGGRDAPITVVNKAEGRSTLELFLHHFNLKSPAVRAHVVIGDNEQGVKTVAGNRDAIGYVSIGTAAYDAEHGTAIKLLSIGGVEATVANVANGSFPLARELNLVTKGKPEVWAAAFIEFARSAYVADIVDGQYFVAVAR